MRKDTAGDRRMAKKKKKKRKTNHKQEREGEARRVSPTRLSRCGSLHSIGNPFYLMTGRRRRLPGDSLSPRHADRPDRSAAAAGFGGRWWGTVTAGLTSHSAGSCQDSGKIRDKNPLHAVVPPIALIKITTMMKSLLYIVLIAANKYCLPSKYSNTNGCHSIKIILSSICLFHKLRETNK